MRPETVRKLLVGLILGIGTVLGLRRAMPATNPPVTKACPELAGDFAL